MDTHAGLLLADIERECAQLRSLVEELGQMGPVGASASRVEVRAAAGILHDFYTGAERLFARVAVGLEGEVPKGDGGISSFSGGWPPRWRRCARP
jgi:hypothetical protein